MLEIICGIFLLAACSPSGVEKGCGNTAKEKGDMTSEMNSTVQDKLSPDAEIPVPAGQETAIFGMG